MKSAGHQAITLNRSYGVYKLGEFGEPYGSEAMGIPSEALQGISCNERVTTTEMSPNNNFPQERPNLVYNVIHLPY